MFAFALISFFSVCVSWSEAESYYYGGMAPKIIYDVPTVYTGLIAPPVVYATRHGDGTLYDGIDRDVKRIEHGSHAAEIIKDVGAVARQKSDSKTGGHSVTKEGEGARNYFHDDQGLRRVHGNQAAAGGQMAYDNGAKGGYGTLGSKGRRKGHQTTGFQKSYHKDESGKNTKYIDEDHEVAHEDFGKTQHNAHHGKAWNAMGAGHDEDVFTNKLGHNSAERSVSRDGSAHEMTDGAHDANGYYYNQDLAYRRRQDLAKDNQMAKIGLGGIRSAKEGAVYHDDLW